MNLFENKMKADHLKFHGNGGYILNPPSKVFRPQQAG